MAHQPIWLGERFAVPGPNVAKTHTGDPPPLSNAASGQARRETKSSPFSEVFRKPFRTSLLSLPWPTRRPLDTKTVPEASFWTPFGRQFGSEVAVVAPCENLIIYYVFITQQPFGTGRVPNKTLTCVQSASETVSCTCFPPLWQPQGVRGLKTELPEGPVTSPKGC